MSPGRRRLTTSRRWVVKIGSSLTTRDGQGLDAQAIGVWVDQVVALRRSGVEVVIVSSGAVAEGAARLGWGRRPQELPLQQAAAAVGQMGLARVYEQTFARHGVHSAQVLLTHDDLADRPRYLNARSALTALIAHGVVPVINENDTVATEELTVGDNDTLAGSVTNLIDADVMVILTDQAGLFERDPRRDPAAPLVSEADVDDTRLDAMAGGSGAWGRGGMRTKVEAARVAALSGTATVIAAGREPDVLTRLRGGEAIGTLLVPADEALAARKRWLAGPTRPSGRLVVDDGAAKVLKGGTSSLLAVGVTAVAGTFQRGALVACVDAAGRELCRGLTNYGSDELTRILGLPSVRFEEVLGYCREEEVIHRDNLIVFRSRGEATAP